MIMRLRSLTPVFLSCLLACAVSETAHAQDESGEIALSDESVQLRYIRQFTRSEVNNDGGELGFGLFWNENRDFVASANYSIEASRLHFNRLSLMAGPVAYAAMLNTENTDVFALALGAEVRFELLRRQGVDIVGRAAYAPDILTFGSADKLWDVIGRVEIPLADRITGFAGYRLYQIDLLEGTTELEESLHLGIRYDF